MWGGSQWFLLGGLCKRKCAIQRSMEKKRAEVWKQFLKTRRERERIKHHELKTISASLGIFGRGFKKQATNFWITVQAGKQNSKTCLPSSEFPTLRLLFPLFLFKTHLFCPLDSYLLFFLKKKNSSSSTLALFPFSFYDSERNCSGQKSLPSPSFKKNSVCSRGGSAGFSVFLFYFILLFLATCWY